MRRRDDNPTPIKPVDGLEVVLVCAPRKLLKEVDLRGKRKMSKDPKWLWNVVTIPRSFCGIGKVIGEGQYHENCVNEVAASCVVRLETQILVRPSPAILINTENVKSKQYFHKSRKPTICACFLKAQPKVVFNTGCVPQGASIVPWIIVLQLHDCYSFHVAPDIPISLQRCMLVTKNKRKIRPHGGSNPRPLS